MDPKWKPGVWNKAADGSSMKVTNTPGKLKMERISRGKEHSHDIVKVDKVTGRVQEIRVGPNTPRKANGAQAAKPASFAPLAPKPQGKPTMPMKPGFNQNKK